MGRRVTYLQLEMDTCKTHGSFHKESGTFTVKTAGIYLIQFNGVACSQSGCEIGLRVNEVFKANSYSAAGHTTLYCPVGLSTVIKLGCGDRVDIFVKIGSVSELTDGGSFNRFSAILLSC